MLGFYKSEFDEGGADTLIRFPKLLIIDDGDDDDGDDDDDDDHDDDDGMS